MIIRNNTRANNAMRYTSKNRSDLSKSLEKLASGYKINRAGDDAAGLAISEKMRRLITGLDRANVNSEEGIKLIQTGDGALGEIHAMLNQAYSLAEQSANGVYDNEIDRQALQAELDELCADIDRIAEGANFNGIKLFQSQGLEYEDSAGYASVLGGATAKEAVASKLASALSTPAVRTTVSQNAAADRNIAPERDMAPARDAAPARDIAPGKDAVPARETVPDSLDGLLEGQELGDLNIVYLDYTNKFEAETTGSGGSSLAGLDRTYGGKELSEILKTEIVPNVVSQILDQYPAFGYLKDSALGIGLELYSENSNVLAYVSAQPSNDLKAVTYTLAVNMNSLPPDGASRDALQDLESTIAHEMIHGFMDEATTAGMFGYDPANNNFSKVGEFPLWFAEGMAQTACGPGNWVHPQSGGGLRIDENSNAATIEAQIKAHPLGSDGGAGDYGTGYLACMYLGWAISSGGDASTPVTAGNISRGLTSLMNEVIGGKPVNTAINELTGGKYSSLNDFQTKFNNPGSDITNFVGNLMDARVGADGKMGRGGLIAGDLTENDLVPDSVNGNTKLFELDTQNRKVTNKYPDDYPVLSGGTVSGSNEVNTPPGFQPAVTELKYGDFVIRGNFPTDSDGKPSGIEWDDITKTLTVTTGNDIEISMTSPTSGGVGDILLNGTGNVTLDGVEAGSLKAGNGAKVTYKGKNDITAVEVPGAAVAVFRGTGQLKVGSFTNNGAVSFQGGAVTVGNGSGKIEGTVQVDKASVAADISPAGLSPIDVDWSELTGLKDIASITFDGEKSGVSIDQNGAGKLWLDPSKSHRITFTDSSGVPRTMSAKVDDADNNKLVWAPPIRPFTVTGGDEGTDYEYSDDGTTLIVKSGNPLTISGGNVKDEAGNDLLGRIKVSEDYTGDVNLILDGVDCSQNTTGSALDLGEGNNVTLTLADGSENSFTGKGDFAGIAVGKGTHLTIDDSNNAGDTAGTPGKLTATSVMSAGIGASTDSKLKSPDDANNRITIKGGNISATGGTGSTGIGGSNSTAFGSIVIEGGTIDAHGASAAAGIGGGRGGKIGDITITGGTITTTSRAGVGIGTGQGAGGGDILISGGTINAQGGPSASGIGADLNGTMGTVKITGGTITASAGTGGAGIGTGPGGHVDAIVISGANTVIKASGGADGVGIGSGKNSSSCDKIEIKSGTVTAQGEQGSTGIGAGEGSTCGPITIGDPDNLNSKVVVTAKGGEEYKGESITSYDDTDHKTAGTIMIVGNNTTVRASERGERWVSTSGVVDADGNQRCAYPVSIFEQNPALEATEKLDQNPGGALPLDISKVKPESIKISSSKEGETWAEGLRHDPLDEGYAFLWLKPEDQTLTIEYTNNDGSSGKVTLDLIFDETTGVFRAKEQDSPKPDPPKPDPPGPSTPPDTPANPGPSFTIPKGGAEGIILQIGAEYGETLEVPRFYLSLDSLGMRNMDISTQENALKSMPVIKDAINRVSTIRGTYGALYNRLGHNQHQLQTSIENLTDAESTIRDVDVAEEMMNYTKRNILLQTSQAMLAQANQSTESVLQLLG